MQLNNLNPNKALKTAIERDMALLAARESKQDDKNDDKR
jgi:hypothetical protein